MITLAIDTDSYSGNFEREMFSHITGMPDTPEGSTQGDEYVSDAAKAAKKAKLDFENLVESRPGEHGNTDVSIVPTPGYFNDGNGTEYVDNPKNRKKFKKRWPSYQSVGIHLSREPTAEELEYIKVRAIGFSKLPKKYEWDKRPTVLGFRIIRATDVSESV